MVNKRRTIHILLILVGFLFIFTSCWHERDFYVEEIDMNIRIEVLDRDRNLFRIYISKFGVTSGSDYIDLRYGMTEMPTIMLGFPQDDRSKIYLLEDNGHGKVINVNSSQFEYVRVSKDRDLKKTITTDEQLERLFRYRQLCDSIKLNTVTVQLNSRLTDLYVWKNQDGKIIYPFRTE